MTTVSPATPPTPGVKKTIATQKEEDKHKKVKHQQTSAKQNQ
jgi:hypothetical protein